jgi:outer membrane protein OmpA-like peptidoglycan-associated protein/tetratricopeptide (TPR) repeat protein
MKKIYLYIVVFMMGMSTVNAQDKNVLKADKLFNKFEFVDAAKVYEAIAEKGKADSYVYKQLGDCYYNLYDAKNATKWYEKAVGDKSIGKEVYYKYAQMLKANGNYQEANKYMEKFAAMAPADFRAITFRKNPNYIPNLLSQDKKFNVQPLLINADMVQDFGGFVKDGKFYFTSARDKEGKAKQYDWTQQPTIDLYQAGITEEGAFFDIEALSGDVNTKYNEGTMSLSPDGNTLYFSRNAYYNGKFEKDTIGISNIKLYKATKAANGWVDVKELPFNSDNFSTGHPAVTADGKKMYFASNRPGGYGQSDIYVVDINTDGSFGTPKNLGQRINTEGNEKFPFMSNKNNLYFSSDGHQGLGGLDVFFSRMVDGKYSKIRNVGVPLNSGADDFSFWIDEAKQTGFFSSNRGENGLDDNIYSFKALAPLCDVLMTVHVTDKKTGEPLANTTVAISDAEGNQIGTKTTDDKGVVEYMVACDKNYVLNSTKDEYEGDKTDFKGTSEELFDVAVALNPIEKIIVEEKIVLNPIYFDFNKSNIRKDAAFELDKVVQVMMKYPNMVVHAESHTDNRGTANYNMKLSDRRAKTTVQYIISKGIDASRISGDGYGESKPNVDCTRCTEEEHQLNRRSEFIIVSKGEKAE